MYASSVRGPPVTGMGQMAEELTEQVTSGL